MSLRLVGNVRPLNEPEFVFGAMLDGWRDQQLSRGLADHTVSVRTQFIRRFAEYCEKLPWEWDPGDLEDFTVQAVSASRPLAKSTIRGYQVTIRLFCDFLIDARYGWGVECETRFGARPQQICHEWNTVAHLVEYEGRAQRRALTYDELEQFFAHADARVESIVRAGKKGSLSALRDAQIFKTVYAYGLRRAETVGLDVADCRPNPAASQYSTYGAVEVRWGKASRGSGPRRRTVLTVPELDWIVEGLAQWVNLGRVRFPDHPGGGLWTTERGTRVSMRYLDHRFSDLRDGADLPSELSLHCLRHTYITNLIEWGYSEKFVQDQVGHLYASTTAIYTSVGNDYKNRVIAQALSRIYGAHDAQS